MHADVDAARGGERSYLTGEDLHRLSVMASVDAFRRIGTTTDPGPWPAILALRELDDVACMWQADRLRGAPTLSAATATMWVVPNHLDFLEVLDHHTRDSPSGEVGTAFELHQLVSNAGLAASGQTPAAWWTGQLVALGYVRARTHMGSTREVPPAVSWTDRELDSFTGFQVTPSGREEADRIRRLRREALTDAALGRSLPVLEHAWLNDTQRTALAQPLNDLQAALDDHRHGAAVGAAKDLAESACKVVLAHAGATPSPGSSLPALFKHAHAVAASPAAGPDSDLGRSLAATVQRLAELRNRAGAGHGRDAPGDLDAAHARLAATAAGAVADFILSSVR